MLPPTLALILSEDDSLTSLSMHAMEQMVGVTAFPDASGLISYPRAFDFGFYVLGY